jgi:hypothetical protein
MSYKYAVIVLYNQPLVYEYMIYKLWLEYCHVYGGTRDNNNGF